MSTVRPIRRALVSVSDKTGVVDFARGLVGCGVEIVSTGGTARLLAQAGVAVRKISELTGVPEMLDGRVKTLHPAIHGGILARRGRDDAELAAQGIAPIDLVVASLYPFEATAARAGADRDDIIEMIDIGGPTMIRAAAKNAADVAVVSDREDYAAVLTAIEREGGLEEGERRRLAVRAFRRTADYDAAIAAWMDGAGHNGRQEAFPRRFAPVFERREVLRYGENPHQRAALYAESGHAGGAVVNARQLQGKPLSFNNLADADAAWSLAASFEAPACVIVKHLNPCGVAIADRLEAAYERAFACDPGSAFGGIIAFNRALDGACLERVLANQFVEVVIAPSFESAVTGLAAAKPNLRLLAAAEVTAERSNRWDFRRLDGGLLVQDADVPGGLPDDCEVAGARAPDGAERDALDFAWHVVQAVRSNAIVIARDGATLGIGAGQMSRVDAVRLAGLKAERAGLALAGSVLASDAFFPFRDNIDEAARLGVRAIVQPGGSRRDAEVIEAANEHGMAMIMTHVRHFRH
ncbi:MAG: bifunctional phosphoribosylaminoimidazolecarboxamide formyltransferase/IMP cyclohydrolase [Gammaproteobacteria bacterium]|nr:bifunctional phosphoribosylaminoimidazolecarboxamide formyltransferase/IMP cyclohydrolase [Gammaproteobacteria bacterium]